MSWYDTGTVSVTNGSTAVTGSGTNFVSGVQVGEGFAGPDGRLYEVIAVVSATALTLADAYLGTTQTAQDYKIVPTQSLVASLATQVSTLISDFQSVADEAGEGKFKDGSAASSGITFTQDQDTGFFRPASNQIGIATAGVQRALVSNTGIAVAGEVSVTGSITATGSVTAGDMFITGPSPILRLTDNDAADNHTAIQNNNGSTFIDGRNATANGDIIFRGAGGGVADEYGRFDSSGHAIVPAGVTLGTAAGVYAAANTLSDYETGTWTPVITDGTNNATSAVAVGSYTKVGNHVHVQGRIAVSSLGSVSGVVSLGGLPFNSQSVTNNFSAMTVGRALRLNISAGYTVSGDLRANVDTVELIVWDSTAGITGLTEAEFSDDGDISFSMDYISN